MAGDDPFEGHRDDREDIGEGQLHGYLSTLIAATATATVKAQPPAKRYFLPERRPVYPWNDVPIFEGPTTLRSASTLTGEPLPPSEGL
jgi:hypothetical protein